MKAAVISAPSQISVQEVPDPNAGPGQVVIEVAACGICGTDLHIEYGGYDAVYPLIPGHEFSGTVAEAGPGVSHLKPGERVAVNPNTPCRLCRYCRRGRFHLCDAPTACGVTYDGGFAQFCVVDASLAVPVGDALPLEQWAMMEPVSCCVHGIDVAGIVPGDRVVILGGGSIGLILLQLARHAGASQLVLSEPRENKRTLALQLGADAVVDPAELGDALPQAVRDMTDGGADVVIEAAGLEATARVAVSLACKGGTVLFFGVCPREVQVPICPHEIFHNELSVKGSYTNPLTDTRAVQLLEAGRVRVAPLVTHRYPLDDLAAGLAAVRRGETVKALVKP